MEKTFFRNDLSTIKNLAEEFKNFYPKDKLLSAIDSFEWGKDKELSKSVRQKVAQKFNLWINKGTPIEEALDNADMVMKWGFGGRKSPESLSKNLQGFCELVSTWSKKKSFEDMKKSMIHNLRLQGISIARTSKWICFVNPAEYCIYDSRVSVCLRKLGEGKGKTFPTVGRRKTERTKNFPNANFRTPEKSAEDYFLFLDVINVIKNDYSISKASDIEMGLFMLGNEPETWLDK